MIESDFSFKRKQFRFKNKNKNKRIYFKSDIFDISLTPLKNTEIANHEYNHIGNLCFCISKKNIPRSVDRHQLKRYLFEFFRLNRKWIGLYDIWIRYNSKNRYNKSDFNLAKITNIIKNTCPDLL